MSAIQSVSYAALAAAQTRVSTAVVDIATNGPAPENATALLEARTQFTAGVKAIHMLDEISKSLLALLP